MADKFIGHKCVCTRGVVGIPDRFENGVYKGQRVYPVWRSWQSKSPTLLSEYQPKQPETWIIRHKTTGAVFTAKSGKSSWKAIGHAKNAWAYGNTYADIAALGVQLVQNKYGRMEFPKFDEQDVYECVNIMNESDSPVISQYSKLLTECIGKLNDFELEERIKTFLKFKE